MCKKNKMNGDGIEKELYRGAVKQFMKVNGLRSVNISNWERWTHQKPGEIHSAKIDIQDGYVNLYARGKGRVSGVKIEDAPASYYKIVWSAIKLISNSSIPSSVKRNIFVKLSR